MTESFGSSLNRELGGDGSEFGVHVKYDDIFFAMAYIAFIYVVGYLGQKFIKMPALVGQIFAGIIFGPELLDRVPFPPAFVLLGEIGLVLLVVEAGVDINVTTLKLIGGRGVIIAIAGSILPIAIGIGVAFIIGADTKAAIAAGASFGPTSLGIAMNILRTGKIINTPTGQLIVAAAIIDDMIALIILSQLSALTGDMTVQSVLQPILVALAFLIIGGYLALFVVPDLLEKFVLKPDMDNKMHGKVALLFMWIFVLGLMPATKYPGASHLMGCFLAGLVFCTDHHLHVEFVDQFKRVLQWLMRIFFASTIGFQVPIKNFGSAKIILHGLFFTVALLGKLVVGFLVPNFNPREKNFTGFHLRDCLLVGCSMAAEGEFAFVIAAAAVDQKIIDPDLYSSVVLAILLSTIIAPFSLRYTITYFNKRTIEKVDKVEEEMKGDVEDALKSGILDGKLTFFCINTTSHVSWGTFPMLMKVLFELGLEVIDHRSWHTRFEDTVINEVYVKSTTDDEDDAEQSIENIENTIKKAFKQEDAVITVTRWLPGIVHDLACGDENSVTMKNKNISDCLVNEASNMLHSHEDKAKRKDTLLTGNSISNTVSEDRVPSLRTVSFTKRTKILSTPYGKTDMFEEMKGEEGDVFQPLAPVRRNRRSKTMSTPLSADMWKENAAVILGQGEVLVKVIGPGGQNLSAKLQTSTLKSMQASNAPLVLAVSKSKMFGSEQLDGFIRRSGRTRTLSNLSVGSGGVERNDAIQQLKK